MVEIKTSSIKAYIALLKPRLTGLAVLSSLIGFYLANEGPFPYFLFSISAVAAFLIGGGGNTLNQCLEHSHDAKMVRTAGRPLPAGHLQLLPCMLFGIGCTTFGLGLLVLYVNDLAAFLGMLIVFSYVVVYTPLKRITPLSLYVGAISGALPPLMGWASAANQLSLEAWVLFILLFVWQIPHFMIIAWIHRDDYAAGGFNMVARGDDSGKKIMFPVAFYTVLLIAVSWLPVMWNMAGAMYCAAAVLLGALFLGAVIRFLSCISIASAKKAMQASIIYLFFLFVFLALNRT